MRLEDLGTLSAARALLALRSEGSLNMAQFEAACGTSRPTANDTRERLEGLGLVSVAEGRLRGLFRDKVIALTPLGREVAAALERADRDMRKATGAADERSDEGGLDATEARLLAALGDVPVEAAVLFQRLGLDTSKGRVALAGLEQKGLIQRAYSPGEDGLGTVIVLATAAGRAAAEGLPKKNARASAHRKP